MKTNRHHSRGFTLLELVVVVAVLALVANLATEYLVRVTDQNRYEASRERLEKLRYAIIGDDSRTSNGQPDLVGFVHDMGRLPIELAELYREPRDCDPDTSGDQVCGATFDAKLGRTVGWRGPYLSEQDAQRDGWGNRWDYDAHSGRILSVGADGVPGGEGYAADLEVRIRQPDYRIDDPVRVTLTAPLGGACLTAQHIRHGVVGTLVSPTTAHAPGDYLFDFVDGLPVGRMAITLREYDGADCLSGKELAHWTTTVYPRRTLEGFAM